MAKGHITRKELKKDVLHDAGESMLDYWEKHRNTVLTSLVVVVALLLLVPGIRTLLNVRQQKSQSSLVAAIDRLTMANLTTDPAERSKLIDQARRQCDDLRRLYPSLKAGVEAVYVKGNTYYAAQDYDQAINLYKNYADLVAANLDKAKAYVSIGICYENKHFRTPKSKDLLDQARDYFQKAEKAGTDKNGTRSYIVFQAMLGQARICRNTGDTTKAAEIFRTIERERRLLETEAKKESKPGVVASSESSERDERLRSIRAEIHSLQAQMSFEKTAKDNLEEMGFVPKTPADATTKTQSAESKEEAASGSPEKTK
jgi:tetratricopeptide (TPR) repeat protein